MNKLGRVEEISIIGIVLFMIFLVLFGLMIQSNNTSTNPDAKEMVNTIGNIFFWCGVFGVIILILIGLIWIIKKFS